MLNLLLYGLIAGLFSLVGGFLVIWREQSAKKIIIPLITFAAGAFLAVSFLDILPEAVEAVAEPHAVFMATLVGFFAFFALERILMRFSHKHRIDPEGMHSEHSESLPILVMVGDSAHNFLDGVVIALSYVANPALGLTTALAIAAHEIPQEIGDFSILLDSGWSKAKIITVNVLSSLLSVVGIFVGYYAGGLLENSLPYLLGAVAGIFIYIAASDLIPEIQDRARHKHIYSILASFLAGLIIVGYLVQLTHH
jgi:zinc and cadmium transporter